jgi:UDP-3-O-[3-hydroxymyristoyl] glucosamine N-acyltransferase
MVPEVSAAPSNRPRADIDPKMVITPRADIDPKMVITPRADIDPGIVVNPPPPRSPGDPARLRSAQEL